MVKISIKLACIYIAGLLACQHEDKQNIYQEIDAVFSAWNHEASPGCALAVIQNGKVIYTKGYGMADLEHEVPITPQSIFYIGSVSKQFVVTALLLLEEEGKVSLKDQVRDYIPEFPDYGYPITIQHLIHHTSGLRDYLTLWSLSGRSLIDDIPENEIFELICRQQDLNFIPGEEYAYSNTCYYLMSIIIERITGQSLREFAEARIFSPLGMQHSQFNDDNQRIIKNRAFGYTQLAEDSIGNLIMRFDLVGSGGLYSSVEDLYLWDQNFYHNQLGTRGQALIEQLQTNGKYNNRKEVNYAYAMINGQYRGLRTIHHTGSMGGYRAVYLRFPEEQFSIIILGNVDSLNPLARAYEVAAVCLKDKLQDEETLEEKLNDEKEENQKPAIKFDTNLSALAGEYYSPELNTTYWLEYKDDQEVIELHLPHEKTTKLHVATNNVLSDNTYSLRFNDNFQTFYMNYAGTRGIIFKKVANRPLIE